MTLRMLTYNSLFPVGSLHILKIVDGTLFQRLCCLCVLRGTFSCEAYSIKELCDPHGPFSKQIRQHCSCYYFPSRPACWYPVGSMYSWFVRWVKIRHQITFLFFKSWEHWMIIIFTGLSVKSSLLSKYRYGLYRGCTLWINVCVQEEQWVLSWESPPTLLWASQLLWQSSTPWWEDCTL